MTFAYADTASMKMKGYSGPHHWFEVFGVKTKESPSLIEQRALPWSTETLRACADTHILFWDEGSPIQDLPECARYFRGGLGNRCYKQKEPFLLEAAKPGWHLIRFDVLPDSLNMCLDEQLKLLGPPLCVPKLPVVIRAAVALAAITEGKLRLHEKKFARCGTQYQREGKVLHFEFGDFDEEGFHVWCPPDSEGHPGTGLATEVLPDKRFS